MDGPFDPVHLKALGRAVAEHLRGNHTEAPAEGLAGFLDAAGMSKQRGFDPDLQHGFQTHQGFGKDHTLLWGLALDLEGAILIPAVGLVREQLVKGCIAFVGVGQGTVGMATPSEPGA